MRSAIKPARQNEQHRPNGRPSSLRDKAQWNRWQRMAAAIRRQPLRKARWR
jgi:hypothetical protein